MRALCAVCVQCMNVNSKQCDGKCLPVGCLYVPFVASFIGLCVCVSVCVHFTFAQYDSIQFDSILFCFFIRFSTLFLVHPARRHACMCYYIALVSYSQQIISHVVGKNSYFAFIAAAAHDEKNIHIADKRTLTNARAYTRTHTFTYGSRWVW